jgi:dienelactone hydrolase
LHLPSGEGHNPLIIIIHGFKAFRQWGFFPYTAEYFASNGFPVMNIDLSANGIIDPEKGLIDKQIFSKNRVSRELEDADVLFRGIISGAHPLSHELSQYWNGEIYLLGHSRGAAISVLSCVKFSEVRKLALWAPIAEFNRYTPRQISVWKEKGSLDFIDSQTGQELSIEYGYIEEILRNQASYDIVNTIKTIEIPTLLLHGENDLTVRRQEAEKLFFANRKYVNFEIVNRANHTFAVVHPFSGVNQTLSLVLEKTLDFYKK